MPHHREPRNPLYGVGDRGASARRSGLSESSYAATLCRESVRAGIWVRREAGIPALYKPKPLPLGFGASIPADDTVILEIKAVPARLPTHDMQLQNDLCMSGLPVGLLPNLHAPRSKMPCAASSGDAAFFSVAHRGSRASSVIKKSGPDTHSTGEWRDAGPQYNDRVECPESRVSRVIRIDGVLHGRFLRELECKIAGKPIEMNDAGH